MKHIKSKKNRGLTTGTITYKSNKHPHDRCRELKVDVPHGETIDASYAAAMVTVRTGMPLAEVKIIKITGMNEWLAGPGQLIDRSTAARGSLAMR